MKIFSATLIFLFIVNVSVGQSYFKPILESDLTLSNRNQRSIIPNKYSVAQLDINAIKNYLTQNVSADGDYKKITLFNPAGEMEEYVVKEVKMMEDGIAARYPNIRTYKGYNPHNKRAKINLGISNTGFYATVASPGASYSIDRYADKEDRFYISYFLSDFVDENAMSYTCGTLASEIKESELSVSTRSTGENLPLRTYRFALACTGEFGAFYGPSKEDVLGEMMKSVNRMNQALENDFAIRLIIVDENDQLIFSDADTDPYPDGNTGGTLLSENTKVISDRIGFANFDIGHVYTRGCDDTGGIAFIRSACSGNKGGGVTCHYSNDITAMAIRVAAHEVGHQLGSNHTFNNCNGNESSSTAYEPGSGSTIMSYGGLCGSELNVVGVADDYYHVSSLIEITEYTRAFFGNNCATLVETTNNIPEVNIPIEGGFSIPISTPFELTGIATDDPEDELTYNWEQFNLGPKATPGEPVDNSPLFISAYPNTSPTRVFPKIESIITNVYDKTEVLPTYDRDLNFQFIARDNNTESGGVAWEEIEFYASSSAGPFLVSFPDSAVTVHAGEEIEITWEVANTDNDIINCQSVDIFLSTDGGFTYDYPILTGTPNDGIEKIFVPNVVTTQARFKIKAANNIFFDISNQNITIEEAENPGFIFTYSPSYTRNCVPDDIVLDFGSEALLDFSEDISFKVTSGIVEGMEVNFDKNVINPGESNSATISFSDPSISGIIKLDIEAQTTSDTVRRSITLDLLSSDFSDIAAVTPLLGSSGNVVSSQFTWLPDSDASEYTFKISDNPSFREDLSGYLYEFSTQDTFLNLPDILSKNTVYYWTVIGVNECVESAPSEIYTFATESVSCSTYEYNDVPLGISQSGVITIDMPIEVIGEGQVKDVNIQKIRGSHSWVSELKGELTSPAGTKVLLFNKKCGNQSDFNAGFDDDALTGITCPLNQGKFYQPEEKLDTFIGEDIAGKWLFSLTDTKVGNGGSVQEYTLELCSNAVLENPYIVNNIEMPLPSGVGRRISSDFLLSEDDNNTNDELVYTLVSLPENGMLLINNDTLYVGSQFSQLDIDNLSLRYSNNGEGDNDYFKFTVEDGEGGWIALTTFDIVIDNNTVLGVDEISQLAFDIFPNPASGHFSIVFDGIQDNLNVSLVDVAGRKIKHSILTRNDQLEVNITGIQKGIYFVVVESDQYKGVRKIVVE
ncbi:reprolysin-like metallopeptidase [Portibacter lacus]|uniref:Metalloprotease Fpp1 n=1 Tax=Portibacter lacus TaxID=1099794 RepID=A0AA37SN74_9BACT|nr:zinc-dependent metalloprotease family protein [Portibacter lacus]GLR16727.1 metalloprotease Fpp1 [Portibacter lacus]